MTPVRLLTLSLAAAALLAGAGARAQGICPGASTPGPGAAIFVAGEATGLLAVFNEKGARLDGGAVDFTVADGFAVGDLDGDGADEIVTAGDYNHEVEIRRIGAVDAAPVHWFGDFTLGDGLAVGNVRVMGIEHIVIVGDGTGRCDIFAADGSLITTFATSMNALDKMALGNLRGDDKDEILIAGDVSGNVDIYDGFGAFLGTLDLDFAVGDGFAAGNVDGSGYDEILIAGDGLGYVDVYDANGAAVTSFNAGFSPGDGFAIGDVDADGIDDIVTSGDLGGDVEVFNLAGTKTHVFPGDFTPLDGLAVGRRPFPDADRDGILDPWENHEYDADGDTTIDADLTGVTDPCHKDLLLEFDWVDGQAPKRSEVQAVKAAFAVAPIDAGGTPNPDGLPGINLVIDTGTLTDPTAPENVVLWSLGCQNGVDDDNDGDIDHADSNCEEGAGGFGSCLNGFDDDGDGRRDDKDGDCREGKSSCSDGFDNDGDTTVDANDMDCRVGDNLGGGNGFSGDILPLDSTFYTAKGNNFSPKRARIFRYAISGDPADVSTGGRGEIGGNDFIEYNHDAGTIMHELGHTLNLRHGGVDDSNCKPNFISVMNYDNQGGMRRTDGSWIIDYSPALRIDNTRGGLLPTLVEDALDETAIMDSTDGSFMMIFTDDTDAKRSSRLDAPVDWEGDGAADDSNTTVNIDDEGDDGVPEACWNGLITSTLESHQDWPTVQLSFRGHGDALDAAVNPELADEPTLAEIQTLQRAISRTDLAVTMADSADPAIAGTSLTYTTTVTNVGKNPTGASHLGITLPAGVAHVSTPGCKVAIDGTLSCDIDMLFPGATRTFTTTVQVDADLVHLAGAPTTINASAVIANVDGDDTFGANNQAAQPTLVKAVADLEMLSTGATGVPAELLIGQTTTVTFEESLTSHGPSSPMDARLVRGIVGAGDVNVSLAEPMVVAPALANGEIRPMASAVSLACTLPGARSLSLTSSLSPARPDDSDPVAANNDGEATVGIECVVPVSIRVRPVMKAGQRGVVPVEIHSNAAGEYGLPLAFDASLIDAESVRFGSRDDIWFNLGGASDDHGRTHGGDDRTMHFDRESTGMAGAETEACVKGTFTEPDGDTFKFFGCDVVRW